MPDLMIENRARRVQRKRQRDRLVRCGLRLDLVLLFDGHRAVDLQAEGRQAEIIGRGDGERDRGDRRDVTADADGPQGDPRLAVAQASRAKGTRAGRSGPSRPKSSRISSVVASRSVQLASRTSGRPGASGRAACPDGPSTGLSASFSLPTSVSSTSVSGRKSRCWQRVVDARASRRRPTRAP